MAPKYGNAPGNSGSSLVKKKNPSYGSGSDYWSSQGEGFTDPDYNYRGGAPGGYTQDESGWWIGTWGDESKGWNVDPRAFQMKQGVPGWAQQGASDIAAKRAGQDMRNRSIAALNYYRDVMSGKRSAAQEAARYGLQQGTQDIAARAGAAQRGGYDPATARAGLLAQQQMGADVAGKAAVASARERNAAAESLARQSLAERTVDVQQLVNMEQLAQRYREMGMTDKYNELASKIAYEKTKMAGYMGEEYKESNIGGLIGAGLGAGAGALAGGGAQGVQIGAQVGQKLFS